MTTIKDNIDTFLPILEKHKEDPILIVVHKDPDLDAIGSACALGLQLRKRQYNCKIWITERIQKTLNLCQDLILLLESTRPHSRKVNYRARLLSFKSNP